MITLKLTDEEARAALLIFNEFSSDADEQLNNGSLDDSPEEEVRLSGLAFFADALAFKVETEQAKH